MLSGLLSVIIPLFVVVAAGYFVGRLVHLSEETLVRTVMDVFMPMLVFHSLYTMDGELAEMGKVAAACAVVLAVLLALSALYARLAKAEARSFIPAVIFMNSGFLGIPVMKLWGGLPAMNLVIVYDQVQTLFIFTLGILIVAGGFSPNGLSQMLRAPMLWAIAAGFLFHFFRITLNVHLAAGVFLRVVLGFLAGQGAALLFGLEDTARTVVIVASSLPSAVFSFVLPARYGVTPNLAAPVVLGTTVLGIVTIPAALYAASLLAM